MSEDLFIPVDNTTALVIENPDEGVFVFGPAVLEPTQLSVTLGSESIYVDA